MNTTSLLLTGQPAPAQLSYSPFTLALLPSSLTTSRPSTPPSSGSSTPLRRRPYQKRRPSRDSPGWFLTDHNPTLDDFASRLNTALARFERYQNRCAQNVVMALIGPTPVVLFVLNPLSLLLWMALGVWWLTR